MKAGSAGSSSATGCGRSPVRQQLQREVLRLVLSVGALDAVAISVLYATHLLLRPLRTRYIFGAVWIALTLFIVLTSLTRIRTLRGRRR
jgi:hypothetical protein